MPRIGKPELKETLLQAGLRCFARKGYHATTLDEIAKEAQVTKGAVYWHYRDKQELFLCVMRERTRTLEAEALRAMEGQTTRVGQIRAILETIFSFYAGNPAFAHLAGLLRSGPDEEFEAEASVELRDFYHNSRASLGLLLKAGMEEGDFAEGSPEMLAAWVLASVDGLVLQWVIDPEEIDLCTVGSLVTERLLQGLIRRETDPL
jgi:AcrR family transcriptional regulator